MRIEAHEDTDPAPAAVVTAAIGCPHQYEVLPPTDERQNPIIRPINPALPTIKASEVARARNLL